VAPVWAYPAVGFVETPMTAIAVSYTTPGFNIAADGLMADEHDQPIDENVQKIFATQGKSFVLAYAMTGRVISDDKSFSLVTEMKNITDALLRKPFSAYHEYSHALGQKLGRTIHAAKESGKLGHDPSVSELVKIIVIGYFQGTPVWTNLIFSHADRGRIGLIPEAPPLLNGNIAAYGGKRAPELAIEGDPRFAKYRNALSISFVAGGPTKTTFEQGQAFVEAYVRLCCEPEAKAIDPGCKIVGGHVHLAQITPDGFQWIIPPKQP
jgi:hypothetical protein